MSRSENRGKKVTELTKEELIEEKKRCQSMIDVGGFNSMMRKLYNKRIYDCNKQLKVLEDK